MKYKLEVWSFGYKSEEFETDDYEDIRKRIITYLCFNHLGIKVFIDGVQVPFLDIKKRFEINTFRDLLKG